MGISIGTSDTDLEVIVGIDVDNDGTNELTWKSHIENPWFWYFVMGLSVAVVLYVKLTGLV